MQPEEVQGLHRGLVDQIGPLLQQVQQLVHREAAAAQCQRCTKRIRGSRHVIFDWSGHSPFLEGPQRFAQVLAGFLRYD
jgi:pimeloyl-ACP methyl ester carboxylesterase